jgi:hypothetical protein
VTCREQVDDCGQIAVKFQIHSPYLIVAKKQAHIPDDLGAIVAKGTVNSLNGLACAGY